MTQQSDLRTELLEETVIVDADVHLSVDADDVAAYCDQPYRSRLMNGSTYPKDQGSDWITPDDRLDESRRLTDVERIEEIIVDEYHIDHPILNINTGIQKLPNDELAVHLMQAYNDYLLDQFLDEGDFYGLMELTTQRPAKAAEEIDRIGDEDKIVGGLISTTGPDDPMGDPSYDVMYRAAEDAGLPIVFHSASGPHFRHDFPKQNQGFETSFGLDTLSHLWSQTLTFTSLITEGVPEKFPGLNFVFLEAGAAWAPYMIWRLNKEYSIQKPQAPLLTRSPEQYARESCYFGSHPIGAPTASEDLETIVDVVGPDVLLFASNYPYLDFDGPEALDRHLRKEFPAEALERVVYEAPVEAFGLDV